MKVIIDYLAEILAGFAILISIYTAGRTDRISKEITNKSFRKEYFDAVFRDFMLETFPIIIIEKIKWKDNTVNKEIYDVEKIIMDFLKKINAYRYIDLLFFQEVYKYITLLDEYIIELIGIRESAHPSQEEYEDIRFKIDKLAEHLYKELRKQYEL